MCSAGGDSSTEGEPKGGSGFFPQFVCTKAGDRIVARKLLGRQQSRMGRKKKSFWDKRRRRVYGENNGGGKKQTAGAVRLTEKR